jgi:hypothetical protein
MARTRLTKQHRQYIGEIKELLRVLELDPEELSKRTDGRNDLLRQARNELCGHAVTVQFLVMDAMLDLIITRYFFGKTWRLARYIKMPVYRTFYYFILEKMYFLQKLELVESIHQLPRKIGSRLKALNDIRNGIAHSISPQTRMRHKPLWMGKSLFTTGGLQQFYDDMGEIVDYFEKHFPFRRQKSLSGRIGD